MKITAISDLHGFLPEINNTDLLIIAGDFSPLEIQQNRSKMEQWIAETMIPWFKNVKAEKIVFIAGNHDFVCEQTEWFLGRSSYEYDFKLDFLRPLLRKFGLESKVEYLCNESCVYNDIKIFGSPYVNGLHGWAFSDADVFDGYNIIKRCDILITHQPPKIGGLGKTIIKREYEDEDQEEDFGSEELLRKVKTVKPKFLFCGHIHGGNHEEVDIDLPNNKKIRCFNVSIKNENYDVEFAPCVVEF